MCAVANSVSKLKGREEYLIAFEEKLIISLQGLFKSIGRNFIIAYGLSALLALFAWGSVKEISFMGAKLAVNGSDLYIFIPFFISAIYILISYQLYRTAEIYRSLNSNSVEITSLNKDARPICLFDMKFFEAGIAGLILALARWQATRLLTSNPFRLPTMDRGKKPIWFFPAIVIWRILRFVQRINNWAISLLTRLMVALALFLIPLILMSHYVYQEFFKTRAFEVGMPLFSLLALVFVAIVTALFALRLFTTYFVDLLETFRKDLSGNAEELAIAAGKLLGSWMIKNMMRMLPF